MKPTMSSTAAGSRITVYFPAGISRGAADSRALRAATSPRVTASRCATLGELAFCHPEESAASIVIEISEDVCVCQSLRLRELKIASIDSAVAKIPAVVSLCRCAMETILWTASARCSGVTAAVSSKYRMGNDTFWPPLAGIGNNSGSGCCTFARLSEACTTRRRLSSSSLLVEARAVLPPNTVRTETP